MADVLKLLSESEKNLFVGIAGPGTGKSTTFKTIIESEKYKGKRILILSFINKLVSDLSSDFKDFSNVQVSTLHSFAMQKLGNIELNENLDDMVSEDYFFIKGIKTNFKEKFFEDALSTKEEEFYKERQNFYKYEKSIYSFNSVIYFVNRFFNENESRIPNYDLILIDEFQDFNKSEFELIKILNKKTKTVVVGDDDQSLYEDFRKAKPQQIRDLYNDPSTQEFSLDYCYRCTEVLVKAVNSLILSAKNKGYLAKRLNDKKFLYPSERKDNKHEISKKYPSIDFISSVSGDLLISKLNEVISKDIQDLDNKRILVLVPHYLKQIIYEGLLKKGFNVVGYELFLDEKNKKKKHIEIIDSFSVLCLRKTDNLSLRCILPFYLKKDELKNLIQKINNEKKSKIWFNLHKETKERIEESISIFKKVKEGKIELKDGELIKFSKMFNLKNIHSKMLNGFSGVSKDAIQVEMTTVMSSKGLSADYVYYVGIDDKNTTDYRTHNFTDFKICEFLVGITRAKEKLTLFSLSDRNPKILEFIDKDLISKV